MKWSKSELILVTVISGSSAVLGWWMSRQNEIFNDHKNSPMAVNEKANDTTASELKTDKMSDQKTAEKSDATTAEKKAEKKGAIYQCPMHPHIISGQPGTCPICHMDLQKVEEQQEGSAQTEKTAVSSSMEGKPEGRAEVSLNLERQQLIGVTYEAVKKENLTREIVATGKVAFDPELYTAIEEYRQALQSFNDIKKNSFGALKSQSKTLVESARTKLLLMGFSENKIRKLAKDPHGGIDFLLPNGKAWIYAEVFEYETNGLKIGQNLEAVLPSSPNNTFKGVISSISPALNNENRTIRVRAEVNDPQRLLRPDSFMNVRIKIDFGKRLVVPDEAVLFSHGKAYVFVSKEEGRFEPRSIEIGEKTSNRYEVLRGLESGEKIVTSANFLIDSESKLRSVLEKASRQEHGGH